VGSLKKKKKKKKLTQFALDSFGLPDPVEPDERRVANVGQDVGHHLNRRAAESQKTMFQKLRFLQR
jgi:hypothetical protein